MVPGRSPSRGGHAIGGRRVLTAELDYHLPAELVATSPCTPRDGARLLVYRMGDASIEHLHVHDLPDLLGAGDLLVRNDTAVLCARLAGNRAAMADGRGGGKVDGLFVEAMADGCWRVMLSAGGRLQPGESIELDDGVHLALVEKVDRDWLVRPSDQAGAERVLQRCGRVPLPPYILKARRDRNEAFDDAQDRDWYRTLYARPEHSGSVAAPTAGLHLTPEVDGALADREVDVTHVTLHVGEGTFKGVTADALEDHHMHAEHWTLGPEAAATLDAPRTGRVIAVGTTTTRLLESLPATLPAGGCSGTTDLLIEPGHVWMRVEGLMTNFHLPRSTLLALVGGLVGMPVLHELYALAIAERYRFYSYGDAMLVLP